MEEADDALEEAGVHLTAPLAGVRVRLRLRRRHVFDVRSAAGAVAVAVRRGVAEGVGRAACADRLLADGAVLVAGVALFGTVGVLLVDRCQGVGFLADGFGVGVATNGTSEGFDTLSAAGWGGIYGCFIIVLMQHNHVEVWLVDGNTYIAPVNNL